MGWLTEISVVFYGSPFYLGFEAFEGNKPVPSECSYRHNSSPFYLGFEAFEGGLAYRDIRCFFLGELEHAT